MSDQALDLARLMLKEFKTQDLQLRQAVVQGITVGAVSLYLSGDSSLPVGGIKYLSSYTPRLNDVVWVIKNGPDLLVIGQVSNGSDQWQTTTGIAKFGASFTNVSSTFRYKVVERSLVFWEIEIMTTGAPAVGALNFNIPASVPPVARNASPSNSNMKIGTAMFIKQGVGRRFYEAFIDTGIVVVDQIQFADVSDTWFSLVSNTNPVSWVNSDGLFASGHYRTNL